MTKKIRKMFYEKNKKETQKLLKEYESLIKQICQKNGLKFIGIKTIAETNEKLLVYENGSKTVQYVALPDFIQKTKERKKMH